MPFRKPVSSLPADRIRAGYLPADVIARTLKTNVSPNKRWEITSSPANIQTAFSGTPEFLPGKFIVDADGLGVPYLQLRTAAPSELDAPAVLTLKAKKGTTKSNVDVSAQQLWLPGANYDVTTTGVWTFAGSGVHILSPLTAAGNIDMTGVLSNGATNAGVELGQQGAANTPYIDFHSGATNVDYDARIIASGGTGVTGKGTLDLHAASVKVAGADLLAPWVAYTPTFTNLTIGNGSVSARFRRIGNTLDVRIGFSYGSTTTTSGNVSVSLPSGTTSISGESFVIFKIWNTANNYVGFGLISGSDTKISPYWPQAGTVQVVPLSNNQTSGTNWTLHGRIEVVP